MAEISHPYDIGVWLNSVLPMQAFPLCTATPQATPWIVYTDVRFTYDSDKDGVSVSGGSFSLYCAGSSYTEAAELAKSIVDTMPAAYIADLEADARLVESECYYTETGDQYIYRLDYVISI
jgi:hypothetical protein